MSKEQHQSRAADATENARHSVALRSAQLTMLRLRLRRHCRRCRRASHAPRSPRPACGCAPRGCDSATRSRRDTSTKWRVDVAVDLRPSSVQLVQHSQTFCKTANSFHQQNQEKRRI